MHNTQDAARAVTGRVALLAGLSIYALPAPAGAAPLPPPGAGAAIGTPAKNSLIRKVAVFGRDDRTRPPAKYEKSASGIGLLINRGSSTACTAFCVAPDIIATAAHCLFQVDGKSRPRLSQFLFARRYGELRDYTPLAGGNAAAAQNVMAGSMSLSVRPPIDATGDWALARLAVPACKHVSLPIKSIDGSELVRQSRTRDVFQLAYHRDFANWRLAYSKPCKVARDFNHAKWTSIQRDFSASRELILHTCDTGGASSGSPILVDGPDGPHVAGINVGTYILSNALIENGQVTRRYKANTIANTAVNANAFIRKLALFRAAKILGSPDALKQLQSELKRHSLYLYKIDGAFGRKTYEAITAFEKQAGLPITGLATEALLKHIRGKPARARGGLRNAVGYKNDHFTAGR